MQVVAGKSPELGRYLGEWATALPEFRPAHWLMSAHAQTIVGSFLASPVLPATHSFRVNLPDGDYLLLHQNLPRHWRLDGAGKPVVLLILHGLGGSHRSGYVRRLGALAIRMGWASYRMDMRGAGESGRRSRYLYHAGRSDDVLQAIQTIRQHHPDASLVVCGFSLGAAITTHLMANLADDVHDLVDAAVAVSPPLDLKRCANNIRTWSNRIYDRNFAKLLWRTLHDRPNVVQAFSEVLPERQPASLYQFDDQVTAPLGGYQGAWDYYQRFSTIDRLSEIRRPTLIITSKDDPLIPYAMFDAARQADAVTLLTTPGGGHLGYVSRRTRWDWESQLSPGSDPGMEVSPNRWIERAIIHCLRNFLGQSSD